MTVGFLSQKVLSNGLLSQLAGHSPRKLLISELLSRADQRSFLDSSVLPAFCSNSRSILVSTRNSAFFCLARSAGVAPIVWSIQADIMSERSRTSWLPSGMQSRMGDSSGPAENAWKK